MKTIKTACLVLSISILGACVSPTYQREQADLREKTINVRDNVMAYMRREISAGGAATATITIPELPNGTFFGIPVNFEGINTSGNHFKGSAIVDGCPTTPNSTAGCTDNIGVKMAVIDPPRFQRNVEAARRANALPQATMNVMQKEIDFVRAHVPDIVSIGGVTMHGDTAGTVIVCTVAGGNNWVNLSIARDGKMKITDIRLVGRC
jgi:hypothetical protein